MSLSTSSSGTDSLCHIDKITFQSSSVAISLHLYCSIGISSGPVALPFFSCLTQAWTSSKVGGGTSSSLSACSSISGSPGCAANFFSRNFAQSSNCCSVLVIRFPSSSFDGWVVVVFFCCWQSFWQCDKLQRCCRQSLLVPSVVISCRTTYLLAYCDFFFIVHTFPGMLSLVN